MIETVTIVTIVGSILIGYFAGFGSAVIFTYPETNDKGYE